MVPEASDRASLNGLAELVHPCIIAVPYCMLACILGHGGEVFFPKLGEDQMLTFSAICDEFVKAEGFEKKQCANDAEAIAYAAGMDFDAVPNAVLSLSKHRQR